MRRQRSRCYRLLHSYWRSLHIDPVVDAPLIAFFILSVVFMVLHLYLVFTGRYEAAAKNIFIQFTFYVDKWVVMIKKKATKNITNIVVLLY